MKFKPLLEVVFFVNNSKIVSLGCIKESSNRLQQIDTKIGVGDIRFSNLKDLIKGYDWNDRISSVLIPEGFEVQIYTNDNFSGNTTDLNGYWQGKTTMQRWRNEGYSQLKTVEGDPYNTNFDNAVSSIQIFNQRGS